jgi:hypothetical protein
MQRAFIVGLLAVVFVRHDALAGIKVADTPVECAGKLNPSLKTLLGKVFPELHIPLAAELDADAVEYDRRQGGDGCYVVAAGDFIGEGRQSVAMILAAAKGMHGRLVVAVRTSSGWRLDQLPTYCGDVFSCYVKVEKPGTFVRTPAVDGPLQTNGELKEMTTKADAIIGGKLESTGVVFAYDKGHWNYVWASD